ncbi:MAG: hypothetical protein AAF297_04755 [Planctomycetota bacterium]
MARLPAVRTPVLAELTAHLARSPKRRLVEQIERAEALAAEITADTEYPTEFLLFRLTGYRDSAAGARLSDVVSGADLIADLSAMVERLSAAARLAPADVPTDAVTLDTLADRWSVSRKTIERFRRRGLVARRVTGEGRGAGTRLVFTSASIAAFETRAGDAVRRAATFRRVDDAEEVQILRRARRYRARLGCSLSAAAERLAVRTGRSHEGVRALLLRHDERERAHRGGAPIFPEPVRRDRGSRFALLRRSRDGAEPAELATLAGNDARGAQRLVSGLRLQLLRRIASAGPVSRVFERDDAESVLLGPAIVREGLSAAPPACTLVEQLATNRDARPGSADDERVRSTAMLFLMWRASRRVAGIDGRVAPAAALDSAETDLRWAWLLQAELLGEQFGAVVRTLEERVGPLDALGTSEAMRLLAAGSRAAARAIGVHSPWRGGRLAAAVTLAVSRSIRAASSGASADTGACREGSRDTGRAGRRVSETASAVDLFAMAVGPTASVVLGVDASVRTAWHRDAARFGASPHGALGRRMGWRGSGPPETLDAVAAQMGTTRMWVARWSRAAVRAGRAGSGG